MLTPVGALTHEGGVFARLKYAWYAIFALAVASIFAGLTFPYTTQMAIIKDAAQNTRAAYQLAHTGAMSEEKVETDTPRPQMRREPLPIVVIAAFLLLHPDFRQTYTIAELTNGPLAETVKGVNAVWRFLAAVFVFLLCVELFRDPPVAAVMAVICLIVSEPLFFAQPGIVDRMYTELPEAALMLLAAWCAVRFVRIGSKLRALGLGIGLGLLALTKVSFFYIGLCFIAMLLATDRSTRFQVSPQGRRWSRFLSTYAVIVLAMVATVAPWVVRNYVTFGNPQIASGTEASVLGTRMLLMEQPLLGQFYLYSPGSFRTRLVGPLTGFTKEDLNVGGRLEQAASVKENKWTILAERMQAEGYQGDSQKWIKHAILNYAVQKPLRYIESIGVFAYKGMWFMRDGGWLFNLVALACFFGLFVGALVTRRQELVAAFGLPVGLFAFVSTFTHALTRYNAAMTPFVIISVLWLIAVLARKAYLGSRGIEISSTPSKLGSGKHLIPSLSPPLGQKRNPTWGLYPRSLKLLFALNKNEDLINKKFDAEGR